MAFTPFRSASCITDVFARRQRSCELPPGTMAPPDAAHCPRRGKVEENGAEAGENA